MKEKNVSLKYGQTCWRRGERNTDKHTQAYLMSAIIREIENNIPTTHFLPVSMQALRLLRILCNFTGLLDGALWLSDLYNFWILCFLFRRPVYKDKHMIRLYSNRQCGMVAALTTWERGNWITLQLNASQCSRVLLFFFFLVFFLMKTVCRYKINSCPQCFMKKLKNIKKYNKTYIIKHMDTHNKA